MPHHWKPVERDQSTDPTYHGKDKWNRPWELVEISEEEAVEIEKKLKPHDSERVLRP